jgi:hypothetical protein
MRPEEPIVLVHPADNGLEEVAIEDELEVIDRVAAGLLGDLLVGEPVPLVLVEEELVGLGEIEAEALI